MKTFIVRLWSYIFIILAWISLFRWLSELVVIVGRLAGKKKKIREIVESYGVVDLWVITNLTLSVILLLICGKFEVLFWSLAIGWGVIRVVEVIIYLINVLLFAQHRKKQEEHRQKEGGITDVPYSVRSYRRLVILLLHNYVEIIFWFALFYRGLDWKYHDFGGALIDSYFTAFKYSFVRMTNIGQSAVSPVGTTGEIVTIIQSAVGLFMVILILARFIAMLPKPKTLDESER